MPCLPCRFIVYSTQMLRLYEAGQTGYEDILDLMGPGASSVDGNARGHRTAFLIQVVKDQATYMTMRLVDHVFILQEIGTFPIPMKRDELMGFVKQGGILARIRSDVLAAVEEVEPVEAAGQPLERLQDIEDITII
ncbi:hypothetical protein BGX34_001969, partial [Mortierella sp. NVP85]